MNAALRFIRDIINFGFEKFGRYYSYYRAFVVDNEDPEGLNRLRLNIPIIHGTNGSQVWVYPKSNYSGKGYGMQVIPSRGDVVTVEFDHGDPNKAVWSYGYFSKGEKPKSETLRSVKNYWFKTPGGHLVELDDNKGVIRLTDKFGNILESNEHGFSLVPKDEKTISLGLLNKSSHPATLGDINANVLTDLLNRLKDLNNAISTFTTTELTIISEVPLFSPMLPPFTTIKVANTALEIALKEIDPEIPKTKSQKVTLE